MNSTTQNARCYQRVTFLRGATIRRPSVGAAIEARTVDISIGGVGLVAPKPLTVGEVVTDEFPLEGPDRRALVEGVAGRVVHSAFDLDGYKVGVEFLEPLSHRSSPELSRAVERL
jgi:c-di-GMP-binding flagellar brake protein YcgR